MRAPHSEDLVSVAPPTLVCESHTCTTNLKNYDQQGQTEYNNISQLLQKHKKATPPVKVGKRTEHHFMDQNHDILDETGTTIEKYESLYIKNHEPDQKASSVIAFSSINHLIGCFDFCSIFARKQEQEVRFKFLNDKVSRSSRAQVTRALYLVRTAILDI